MNKPVSALVGMAAAMVMSGCATVYRVSESAPTPIPQPPSGRPAMRNPAVSVRATPGDSSSGRLASALQSSVERDLAARGFDVLAKPPVDSIVSMSVSRRETARLSEWRVYEGSADARVTDTATGRLVAGKTFKVAGERSADEMKAEASVTDGLSGQVTSWLATALPAKKVPLPPTPPPPDRMTATISIAPENPSADPMEVLRIQRCFMDHVASRPGIASCRLLREDPARREFSFLVEYETRSFPGGLLNTIVLDCPKLGGDVELKIVR